MRTQERAGATCRIRPEHLGNVSSGRCDDLATPRAAFAPFVATLLSGVLIVFPMIELKKKLFGQTHVKALTAITGNALNSSFSWDAPKMCQKRSLVDASAEGQGGAPAPREAEGVRGRSSVAVFPRGRSGVYGLDTCPENCAH